MVMQVLQRLVQDARSAYQDSERDHTRIYTAGCFCDYWDATTARPSRPLASVVLPHGVAQTILEDARDFLADEEWYTRHGVPYRRGYLLHGPPGTGATPDPAIA